MSESNLSLISEEPAHVERNESEPARNHEKAPSSRAHVKPAWLYARVAVGAFSDTNTSVSTGNSQLTGNGQKVAIFDSGLDSGDLKNLRNFDPGQIKFDNVSLNGRSFGDQSGHGTHVAGIISHTKTDAQLQVQKCGIAPLADLVIQFHDNRGPALQSAWDNGARIHNSSNGTDWYWSSKNNSYTNMEFDSKGFIRFDNRSRYYNDSVEVDKFSVNNRSMAIVIAAGNKGKPQSIMEASTAKNAITVGSCRNDVPDVLGATGYKRKPGQNRSTRPYPPISCEDMSVFSSRGPTDDQRIKPDLVAPGECILAPMSSAMQEDCANLAYNGFVPPDNWHMAEFVYACGTSMAAPVTSACVALLRQWLQGINPVVDISAALIKALLINGAERLPGCQWGDMVQGWGRINLRNVVAPTGGRTVKYYDETVTLKQGETAQLAVELGNNLPVKITLVWIDPPGAPPPDTASSDQQKAPLLVNNLDLRLLKISEWSKKKNFSLNEIVKKPLGMNPDRQVECDYIMLGNDFTDYNVSDRVGIDKTEYRDCRNNVECIILDSTIIPFTSGTFMIQVIAESITQDSCPPNLHDPTGPSQSYALVISGGINQISNIHIVKGVQR